MDYLTLKTLHVSAAALSYSLFVLRGLWMMGGSPMLAQRWVRVVPHLVDTVLLAAAIALAVMSRQYPLQMDWLTAKVAALIVYIVLGSVAIKHGRTLGVRVLASRSFGATWSRRARRGRASPARSRPISIP